MKRNLIYAAVAAFGLAAAPASAQIFEGWDGDGDGYLSEPEYEAGFGDVQYGDIDYVDRWDDWDIDDDDRLSDGEFSDGLFETLDDDRDGMIGRDEWGDSNLF